MNKKLAIAVAVSLCMTTGTYFYDYSGHRPAEGTVAEQFIDDKFNSKGFPFSFVEQKVKDGVTDKDVSSNPKFLPVKFIVSWISWFLIVAAAFILLYFIAGFMGKLIARVAVIILTVGYSLLVTSG